MMVEMNGDLKWKADEAIDEAYRRGYEDAKKEFIGKSAKQIQIKYHDDFATALEKMYEYEEQQKRYDIEKVYDPIEGAERYTFVPKKERQTEKTEDDFLKTCIENFAERHNCTLEVVGEYALQMWEQMRKEKKE